MESKIVKIKIKNFSSGNIIRGEMRETLCMQLFDETIVDMLDESRSRETEIYQRIEKKWIGELRIPFSTIYTTQRVEFWSLFILEKKILI